MAVPERIATERLVLRKPRLGDAQDIFDGYATDAEVLRYLPMTAPEDITETEAFLRESLRDWDEGTSLTWVITFPDDDRCLGLIALRLKQQSANIGYVLCRQYWGQGLMPEAARAVLEYALSLPHIREVSATCDVDNAGSRRVLEKIGMTCEGLQPQSVVRPNLSDEPRDSWVYAITK
jgi:[ribosomal protein S5]-alanine N-acetyltransferase